MEKTLANQRVLNDIIKLLKQLYKNAKVYVNTLAAKEKFFEINREVKQRDPLFLNIFNAVLETVFKAMNWSKKRNSRKWKKIE